MLLEAVMAISIVTIIMTGLVSLLVTVTHSTAQQRSSRTAAQLADAVLDKARAVGAASAVSGRDATSSASQFAGHTPATPDWPATASAVAPWLATMTTASDSTAAVGAGQTATLPTIATHQVVNGTSYSVSDFVGYCWRLSGGSDCTTSSTGGAIQYVRVVVVLAWSGGNCPSTGCDYLSATLLNSTGDPVFNFNQSPPPVPVVTPIPTQTSAIGDAVAGVAGISGCAAPCAVPVTTAVPPVIFNVSGLPPGLAMDTSGLFAGTPTTQGTYAVSLTVTDAFLDSATTNFSWVVKAALTFNQPADQANTAGAAVSLAMAGASGGSGSGYTWSAVGLPPGLSINAGTGTISGTIVSTAGSATPYGVTVTLTDSTGTRHSTQTFAWSVAYLALSAAPPADQVSTKNWPSGTLSLAAGLTGGSGTVTWSDPGNTLPAGLAITSDKQGVTGTPTALVAAAPVTLTVTDTVTLEVKQITFHWTVVAAPTVAGPGSVPATSLGGTPTATAVSTCPNSPCTITATGLPTGLSISTAGVMTGTVSGATGSFAPTLTITDADGASSTGTFTWPVVAAPTIATPAAQTTSVGAILSFVPTVTCPATPCTYTVSAGTLPAGLAINAGTGVISGTPTAAGTSSGIKLTIKDADNSSTQTAAFTWTVVAAPTITNPAAQASDAGTADSFTPTATCPGTPCTYSVSAGTLPTGLSINAATGTISGTPTTAGTSSGIKLTITDVYGVSKQTAAFTWTINPALNLAVPNQSSVRNSSNVNITLATWASGGSGGYTYAKVSGPAWVTIVAGTTLRGVPPASPGTNTVKISVTDSLGVTFTETFNWTIT